MFLFIIALFLVRHRCLWCTVHVHHENKIENRKTTTTAPTRIYMHRQMYYKMPIIETVSVFLRGYKFIFLLCAHYLHTAKHKYTCQLLTNESIFARNYCGFRGFQIALFLVIIYRWMITWIIIRLKVLQRLKYPEYLLCIQPNKKPYRI